MGRMKYKGSSAAVAKAAKAAPQNYKVYDGATPPRAPYRLRLINMRTKYNTNGHPYISVFAAIDEPPKKQGGKTNPKAQYNNATVRGSTNQNEEYADRFNGFLASMGCTQKDITSVWRTGFTTVDNPKGDDGVGSLGSVKIDGVKDLHFYGMVDMVPGGVNKATKKKYPDRLEVVRFLVASDIMEAGDSEDEEPEEDEELEGVDEDEESDEDSEDEDEDEDEEESGDEALEERQSELEGMTRTDLKALVKKLDPAFKVTASVKDEQIIDAILDLEFPEDEGEEEEDEPEDEEESEDEDDLAELDRTELKALNKSENLGVKVLAKMSDDDLREAIREAREGGSEENEAQEEEEEPAKPAKKARRSSKGAGEPPF